MPFKSELVLCFYVQVKRLRGLLRTIVPLLYLYRYRVRKVSVLKEYQTPDYDDVFERPPFAVLFSTTVPSKDA